MISSSLYYKYTLRIKSINTIHLKSLLYLSDVCLQAYVVVYGAGSKKTRKKEFSLKFHYKLPT